MHEMVHAMVEWLESWTGGHDVRGSNLGRGRSPSVVSAPTAVRPPLRLSGECVVRPTPEREAARDPEQCNTPTIRFSYTVH